ncbi:M48 family metallopeptidase [Trinickia acidisoli]|uniref:M48 family metallopeptidase n=1 Tax=Trinickia acidisoli TaxID=2767482 RepID=UPI002852EC59|nr:M48 family metallopeptidase [Trinickia acidisoli]
MAVTITSALSPTLALAAWGAPAITPAPGAAAAAEPASREPIRFGQTRLFRNLLPPPVVEAQSIAEYDRLMDRARGEDRLLPADDPRVKRLRTLLAKLSPLATKWSDRTKDWRWEVSVIRSRDVRMVSFPGGKLVVYSGLLERVHLNDDEMAMLFGHEIAHALREQVREQLGEQRVPLAAVALSRLFGVSELGEPSTPAPTAPLASLEFDATDETEADVIGSDIASRAGFDPRAAVTLWDKLALEARGEKDGGFIAIHPYSAARRLDLIKRLPDMLALYAKARGITVEQLPAYAGMRATKGSPKRN